MNLRDLQYLVSLADYQHFGKAAKACFVSQPTLSIQLKKLEDELCVQLFERNNRRVLITDAGEEIARRAREILRDTHEMVQFAKSVQDPFAGELRIGIFPTLGPYLLPKIIPRIARSYAKLKLLIVEEKTATIIDQLQEGKLDTALLATPIECDDFEFKQLFSEPFYLAVPKSHPLAKRKLVRQTDLLEQNVLLLEDGHCLRQQALEICSLMGTTENQDFRATSLETLKQMVAANTGITLVPELAVKKSDVNITYIAFPQPKPSRSIGMFWRKTSARKKLLGKIAAMIQGIMHQ